jgi:hypothetical protein
MQVLWLLIERWIDKICTKQLTKTEAWLSLRMGVAKALRYPLTATCLSKKDCKILDKKLLAATLPALGFPPKYPHKIAQAPPEALGLVIPSIWNDQSIDHVTAMLRHVDSNPKNITGCLFRDEMTTLRFELGLPGYPFDTSYKRFHLCSTPYLHRAWELCNDHDFRIQDNRPHLLLRRVDNQYLMQAFTNHGYTDKQLKKLNLCRMWTKVITLADTTTGDGKLLSSSSPTAIDPSTGPKQENQTELAGRCGKRHSTTF